MSDKVGSLVGVVWCRRARKNNQEMTGDCDAMPKANIGMWCCDVNKGAKNALCHASVNTRRKQATVV